MSSRPPVAAPGAYRQEDDRKRDEARMTAMENQLDEVRRLSRELLSRQTRFEEAFKQYEGAGAQNRLALEQLRQEAYQTAQARSLDENRTRQHLGDMEARLDDATRPIRSLQAHVTELLEASRKKVDDTGQHQKRFDELRALIEHNTAHIDRTAVVSHQLRDTLDLLRSELDGQRRDILRAEDAIKIVDQEARRRVAEIAQGGEHVGARIDEIRSDLAHLFDLIEDTRRSIVHIDPALEALREVDVVLRADLTRLQAQAIERHELLLERAEDTRQEVDARFDDIRQTVEQRAERLAERIESSGEQDRDLAFRISALSGQLDELRQVDASLRRDIWYLHEQRVRLRFEQIQQELDIVTGQRRDAETAHANGGAPEPRALRRPAGSDLDH